MTWDPTWKMILNSTNHTSLQMGHSLVGSTEIMFNVIGKEMDRLMGWLI